MMIVQAGEAIRLELRPTAVQPLADLSKRLQDGAGA